MNIPELISTTRIVNFLNKHDFDLFHDNDDDSEDEKLDEEVGVILQRFVTVERVCVQQFWEHTAQLYNDVQFMKFFRISRSSFKELAKEYEASPGYQRICSQSLVTTAEKSLAIFIWFCATEAVSYQHISNLFNVALSTVHVIIRRLIAFVSCLAPQYIKWPNEAEMKDESDHNFDICGIRGVIGAVDGTHIRIDPPPGQKDDYIDRKGDVTMMVQAVCNSKNEFIHVSIGYPGSIHDALAFRNSTLPDILENLPKDYLILGDSAYPLSHHLLTPYKNTGRLTAANNTFNFHLSKGRVMIEHSFGILKQRFRQLYYCKLKGTHTLRHFIRACFVLHNICKLDGIDLLQIDPEQTDSYPPINVSSVDYSDNEVRKVGKAKRDMICATLKPPKRRRIE